MDAYTPREVATAAGVSDAVLDYWDRTGLIARSEGGGYTAHACSLAIVVGEAHRLGAPGPALAALVERLGGPASGWPDDLWLTASGDVRDVDDAPAALVVHVRRLLTRAGPLLALALAAA